MDKLDFENAVRAFQIFQKESKISDVETLSEIIWKLANYARILHYLAEKACERSLYPYEEETEEKIKQKVQKVADQLGFEVMINGGDARGYSIGFLLPSKTTNSFGGIVFGVNWY